MNSDGELQIISVVGLGRMHYLRKYRVPLAYKLTLVCVSLPG